MLTPERAQAKAVALVERAMTAGADAADAIYSGDQSATVQVRLGDLEQVGRAEGEDMSLRVFLGHKSASVASSDLSDTALAALVERVLAMAGEAPEDPFAGLAPSDFLHRGPPPDLDLADDREPSPDALRERALAAETAALGIAGVTNSGGASAGASAVSVALATSAGFAGAFRTTGHSCSASVVAGEGSGMQRDYAWHSARHLEDLEAADVIGRRAGERAAARLGTVKVRPGRMPVLFDPRVAPSLLGHFGAAINGAAVARKASFLQDRLGERIFAAGVRIVDDPLRRRGLRSRPFDGEGVRIGEVALVDDGVLTGWMADSAAARQLGIAPTGHAARRAGSAGAAPSNFTLAAGPRSREDLLAAFPEAILVTELIGQGANVVTGDYSRGAAGFLVRGGEIVGPVSEITVASNLQEMFATLEPGSDLSLRHGIDAPTVLVPEMTVGAA